MKTIRQFLNEAYGKGYVSPLDRIQKAIGKKLTDTEEFRKKMKELDDRYEEIKKKD